MVIISKQSEVLSNLSMSMNVTRIIGKEMFFFFHKAGRFGRNTVNPVKKLERYFFSYFISEQRGSGPHRWNAVIWINKNP